MVISIFNKIFSWIKLHTLASLILAAVTIFGCVMIVRSVGGNSAVVSYTLDKVSKGSLISSISGSGQISATNQVDVKAKASGDMTAILVKQGQEVKAGAVLGYINSKEALKSIRDAQTNLDSAKLSLSKLKKPADALSILQAENALTQSYQSKDDAAYALNKAYDDGFNTVSNAFLDLPAIMSGLNDMLFGNSIDKSQANIDVYASAVRSYDERVVEYKVDAGDAYAKARAAYDVNFETFKNSSRSSDVSDIEALITQTYNTVRDVAEAVKNTNNLIQFYKDKMTEHYLTPESLATTHLSALNGYTSKTNSHLLNLLAISQSIKNAKNDIVSADRSISEKTQSLADLKSGADPLDIASQELSVRQRENALLDAREKLADYSIRAPFDGVVAKVSVKKGDTISSGSVVVTMVTKDQMAEISLNEVDVAKIKVGQKVTLTFDAVEDLSIAGEVAEIDSLGTVSQGVVSYSVKIMFKTQDERVKPGMTVSATIITDVRQDVLLVSSGAIKNQNADQYVEVFDVAVVSLEKQLAAVQSGQGVISETAPTKRMVQIGISNDTQTEVVSGLVEGDVIVVRTVAPSSAQATSQAPSLFGNIGGNRSGAVRVQSR